MAVPAPKLATGTRRIVAPSAPTADDQIAATSVVGARALGRRPERSDQIWLRSDALVDDSVIYAAAGESNGPSVANGAHALSAHVH
jgi:hypothetical protein